MGFGAVKILDINGLSYLYTKLNNSIESFQENTKSIIDTAAAAANSAADRANAVTGNIDGTYATKEELKTSIDKITSFEFNIVTVLPSEGVKGTIYLMENTGNQTAEENIYDEYIWVGDKYEKIGTTDINFSKYSTSQEIADAYLKIADAAKTYATKGEVATIDSKVDANTTSISTHSANTTAHITADERKNWNAAKTHADSAHARTDATKVEKSTTNGNIKINGTETNVYTHPAGTNPHGTTKADVGLGNVGNFKAVSTVASQGLTDAEKANARANIGVQVAGNYASATHTHTAAEVGAIATNAKGTANGVASLDGNGKVPSAQLPSYVDDVIEGYFSGGKFYSDSSHTKEIAAESGKIYTDLSTSKIYRWSGSAYAVISDSIALGETASTAYAGDKGKAVTDALNTHKKDTTAHVTASERTSWNAAAAFKYAAASTAGGSANSAVKLDTATAGSATKPVYFANGKPAACTYSLAADVPANAKFTDTNTWRGIQNNLTSDSTTDSLSAAQGKALKALIDGKAASSHTHNYAGSSSSGGAANSALKLATARNIALSGAVTGSANFDGSSNITIATKVAYGTSVPSTLADGQLFCVIES